MSRPRQERVCPSARWVGVATCVAASAAGPAMGQTLDLSPMVTVIQQVVDFILGPFGILLGTLILIGLFAGISFEALTLRQAIWIAVGLIAIPLAPAIATAIFT